MKYSEINIGDKETLSHKITKEDLEKFVALTGDDNKLHVDEKFASTTQFKKPVVHGMLGASFISTIIGTKLPGDGALWFSQSLEFLLPVRVGDNLTVNSEVVKKNDKENIIELKTDIYNQNRQLVTRGYAKVKVIEQEVVIDQIEDVELKPKVALIIGGTGGIGRAACIQLARDGMDIIIHYNSNKTLAEKLKNEVETFNQKAIIVKADITNELDIKQLFEKSIRAFDKIDVLVNCAAATIPDIKFQDLLWSDFQLQLDLNIKSTFTIIKEVLPYMLKSGYGKIITVGSAYADKPNSNFISHYITAKSALVGLTKGLAYEFAPKGIRVNMVSPSLINTDLTADIPEKIKLLTAAQTPLRRLANVTDVAGAISFLASDKSDFITGENIRLNGGQIMV